MSSILDEVYEFRVYEFKILFKLINLKLINSELTLASKQYQLRE